MFVVKKTVFMILKLSVMNPIWKRSLLLLMFLFFSLTGLFAADGTAIDSGATAWMLTSTALVLLMIPGLAMFYGGLVRSKNVLGTIMHSYIAMGIISVLWVIVGYSMCFGGNVLGGWFGWNPDYFFLKGIDTNVMDAGIPEYVFSMFQGKFAIITPALIAGAFAERVSFKAYCFFIALWSLLVYNPLCHWVWGADGFLFKLGAKGAIDFAGGTVVHISAGISGLVAALYLRARRGYPYQVIRPNNMVITMLGAGLLWVGWFGFNAGSAAAAATNATSAFVATQIATGMAAVTWAVISWAHTGRPSTVGAASGAVAGLVAITPASGFVSPMSAIVIGIVASIVCYAAVMFKNRRKWDDALDTWGVHGIGGLAGALLTGLLAEQRFTPWGHNGLVFGNPFALVQNAVGAFAALAWAVGITALIIKIMDKVWPGGIRVTPKEEEIGLDLAQHGERAYVNE